MAAPYSPVWKSTSVDSPVLTFLRTKKFVLILAWGHMRSAKIRSSCVPAQQSSWGISGVAHHASTVAPSMIRYGSISLRCASSGLSLGPVPSTRISCVVASWVAEPDLWHVEPSEALSWTIYGLEPPFAICWTQQRMFEGAPVRSKWD